MLTIEGTLLDFRQLDQFAAQDTGIHHIDARAKLLVTLFFLLTVLSFNNHSISQLIPFFIFPAVTSGQGNIPLKYIFQKLILVMPFALMIGILNPFFDRTVLISIGPADITGGWISCLSIFIRTVLTVSSGLILVCVTGFNNICQSLKQMGVPQIFAMQLLFLYRYIFILAEEVSSTTTAHALRSCRKKQIKMKTFAPLLGSLLLRTWDRAERVHLAMLSRGYNGEFKTGNTSVFSKMDFLYIVGWSILFVFMRFYNLSEFFGRIITGMTT